MKLGILKLPFWEANVNSASEANVNGMELREGSGNVWNGNKPSEDDILNVVWVVDSKQLPFYRAEKYHQYHTGIGKMFPWVSAVSVHFFGLRCSPVLLPFNSAGKKTSTIKAWSGWSLR
eukprot:1150939-Pelagomonas_calceolata.AAC.2